ncbi:MAG: ABC transporter ATP-binding protein [Clostridia bacterium]|nr:ABC transporter ATP-binding protein [Clostridia bacterium]
MLQITNLSKTYTKSNTKAVDNLDLHVNRGEIFGFLGPNGAGKSTTIKMIAGILNIDSGSIMVNGVDVVSNPLLAKRQIGYVSDNHNTFDRLTGLEYLRFMGEMYDVEQRVLNERIDKYLTMFNLTEVKGDRIKTYSHGMQQKIVIIGALIHDPLLWILDEPLTGLDPASAYQLKQLMKERTKEGCTVFFSSHVIEVVEKLCDRIAIINKGRIVAVDTLDNIRADSSISLEDVFLQATRNSGDNAKDVYGE